MVEVKRSVSVHNAHPRLRLSKREIQRAIATLDAHCGSFIGGCPAGELSIVLLTDPALARIHADFMDDPTATDVITFEGNPALDQAGEICVSADTAAAFVGVVRPDKRSVLKRPSPAVAAKFSSELTLYLVHGWLHLAGYDDLQPAKKRRMRAAEKRAMALLQKAKAMPSFRLV